MEDIVDVDFMFEESNFRKVTVTEVYDKNHEKDARRRVDLSDEI